MSITHKIYKIGGSERALNIKNGTGENLARREGRTRNSINLVSAFKLGVNRNTTSGYLLRKGEYKKEETKKEKLKKTINKANETYKLLAEDEWEYDESSLSGITKTKILRILKKRDIIRETKLSRNDKQLQLYPLYSKFNDLIEESLTISKLIPSKPVKTASIVSTTTSTESVPTKPISKSASVSGPEYTSLERPIIPSSKKIYVTPSNVNNLLSSDFKSRFKDLLNKKDKVDRIRDVIEDTFIANNKDEEIEGFAKKVIGEGDPLQNINETLLTIEKRIKSLKLNNTQIYYDINLLYELLVKYKEILELKEPESNESSPPPIKPISHHLETLTESNESSPPPLEPVIKSNPPEPNTTIPPVTKIESPPSTNIESPPVTTNKSPPGSNNKPSPVTTIKSPPAPDINTPVVKSLKEPSPNKTSTLLVSDPKLEPLLIENKPKLQKMLEQINTNNYNDFNKQTFIKYVNQIGTLALLQKGKFN